MVTTRSQGSLSCVSGCGWVTESRLGVAEPAQENFKIGVTPLFNICVASTPLENAAPHWHLLCCFSDVLKSPGEDQI